MNPTPPVTVIIVAWNQLDKTLDCLETVVRLDYANFNVLLVDNGSEPPLADAIQARFPAVEIARLPENLGFAGGYNAGIRRALLPGVTYVLLLNNDTLVDPAALTHLMAEMQTDGDVGLVTAKLYYADDPQRIWSVGANFNVFLDLKDRGDNQLDVGQWAAPRTIAFAPFCGILVRRKVFESVGFLDEGFFLYYEDVDYCLRARAAGWRMRLSPAAHVWHAVSASSGGQESPARRYWLARSGGRYFRKHGRGPRMLLIAPFRLGSALKTSLRLLLGGRGDALRAYWAGLRAGWLGPL